MKIRRDPTDAIFSQCIRESYNWTCAYCHKQFDPGAQNLHASHLFSRRHNSTRWSPENVFAHCFTCHTRLGGDPVTFSTWAASVMGPKKLEALRTKAHMTLKVSKADKAYITAHYRRELERLKDLRGQGHNGFIHLVHWGES